MAGEASIVRGSEMKTGSGGEPAGQVLGLMAPSLVAMGWLIWQAQWFWSHVADLNFGWVVVLIILSLLPQLSLYLPVVSGLYKP